MTVNRNMEALIQRSLDETMSDAEMAELARHLAAHPEEASRLEELRRQNDLIAASVPTPSHEHLRALRQRASIVHPPVLRIAASIVIFALGVGLGTVLPDHQGERHADLMAFAGQAKAAHALYVTEVLHPVEVAADEKDHLQSWLSNRLGAVIIAPQLGETGYHLIGGRLLPAGDQASALFMYENADGDRLSLLAKHGASNHKQSFRFHEDSGYLVVSWQDGSWQYSLVGQAARVSMDRIARIVHGQLI